MSEKRFIFVDNIFKYLETGIKDNKSEYDSLNGESVVDLLNELAEENEQLKERLYDFEKRKIIEESEIDEDVIPKVKLLRTEFFGEKYE